MGIERLQFHINIYRDIFENILELINKVIVALRCFQFRWNSFLFFLFHHFRLWQITLALALRNQKPDICPPSVYTEGLCGRTNRVAVRRPVSIFMRERVLILISIGALISNQPLITGA